MPRSPSLSASLVRDERGGRLESVRMGIRYASEARTERSGPAGWPPTDLVVGELRPGAEVLGPVGVQVGVDAGGDVAHFDVRVVNRSEATLFLEAVLLGFRWRPPELGSSVRFLRHGWQSWSFTGGRLLDEAGEPPFPSGPWLRALHHGLGTRPAGRASWHESDLVSVAATGEGAACLAGVLEGGAGSGVVYLRREPDAIRVEVEVRLEVPLEPGESLDAERVQVALGGDENALLEAFGDALGRSARARTGSPLQSGWSTWYQFFHGVSEVDLLRNLEALVKARSEIPIELVQLDDGYQHAVGDWLETNPRFPRGIAPLARDIRDAGFRAGIWTAPFCVAPESRLHGAHPEWLLGAEAGPHRGVYHPQWSSEGWIYALDPTQEAVTTHLLRTFAALVGMGFSFLKLDFLYVVAMQARASDPRVSRAGRLRRGLEAIRRGAGEEAFLLGCGCPLGAAVGFVDGMRIGPDVAPQWEPAEATRIPGLEPTQPAAGNAVRATLARAWMHRRLWSNDPDCVLLRSTDTGLTAEERTTLAGAVALGGGMVLFSDEVSRLSADERGRLRETLDLAREVDTAGSGGVARAWHLLEEPQPRGLLASTPAATLLLALNPAAQPRELSVPLDEVLPRRGALPPQPLLGTPEPDLRARDVARSDVGPHGSLLLRVPGQPRIAVFCDYDGTFARQDVGSSLAKRYAGERRPALWERLRRGELTPWAYNMELLDGLALPEEQLDAFLQTVEPDPGAGTLLDFCEAHGIPFRVLSDGFDRNLDRLQEIHGLRFAYDANRLWYEGGVWRIAPGHPDPACSCGTGVCKRSRIVAFRSLHPEACVVHVGNGRVSDLCAARAADVVFAKDTLAEELTSQGVAFEPFETLHDVVAGLERLARRLGG